MSEQEQIQQENPIIEQQENPIQENPIVEQQENPIVEQQENPILAQQENPILAQQENPIVEQENPENTNNTTTINIPVSKENLNKSAVAVNANVLANLVLYKSILQKIEEETEDSSEKSDIESKAQIVENLIQTSKELLQLLQITLNIPEDQQLDEETIINKSKGDIDSKFKMFNVAESLGFLGLGLALLGGKNKKSGRKTRRNKFTSIKKEKGKKKNTRTKN